MSGQKTLVTIIGPTAIGKTALAIQLAQHFKTAIISADSRQFYIEMSIGTAKPSDEELSLARHHFINNLHINETYTVGDYEKEALTVIHDLFKYHDVVILAGGSGLFIDAICNGFDELPKAENEIREQLNKEYTETGLNTLLKELKSSDLDYYLEVDKNNPHRIIRALEVIRTSNRPFSSFRNNEKKKRPFNILKIGLNTDREILYSQINQRVNQMLDAGLVDEVQSLLPHRNLNALRTVGYTEIFDYLDNKLSLEQATLAIQQNTRRFAKRQLTWFRKDREIQWFQPNQFSEILDLASRSISKT